MRRLVEQGAFKRELEGQGEVDMLCELFSRKATCGGGNKQRTEVITTYPLHHRTRSFGGVFARRRVLDRDLCGRGGGEVR